MDINSKMLLWSQVATIGQVMGAIATFLAVVVSLCLARSERKPHLRVSAGLRMIIPGDGTPATDIISVKVENVGARSARIASVGWLTGWRLRGPAWLQLQMAVQVVSYGSPRPPIDIAPGTDVSFFVTIYDFRWEDLRDKNVAFFGRRPPWFSKPIPANIRVLISVVGAHDIRKKVEPSLARFLVTGEIMGGAEDFNAHGGLDRKD